MREGRKLKGGKAGGLRKGRQNGCNVGCCHLGVSRARNSYTILDCVYSDSNGVFYILDMMCWDGYQVSYQATM